MDYKSTIKWLREQIDAGKFNEEQEEMFREQFPELAESEDERIREKLKAFLWDIANGTNRSMPCAASCQEWITYLEKQKPTNDKSFEDWIDGWYNEHHRDGYITMDEREFKNWSRGIRNMYQQKPAEWSDTDNIGWDEAFR